jgi:hypothetical protein
MSASVASGEAGAISVSTSPTASTACVEKMNVAVVAAATNRTVPFETPPTLMSMSVCAVAAAPAEA